MLKVDDSVKGIDVSMELTDTQRSLLASSLKQESFDILQKIMEEEVRKFNLKLINTDPAKQAEVTANHYMAKSIAQWYTGLMDRLKEECEIDAYNSRCKVNAEPVNDMQIVELQ